jgi:hypothetical protein
MSSVGMVINTTKERCRRVLPDHLDQKVWSTRMLFDKRAHVVDEAGNEDKRPLLGLLLDYTRGSGKKRVCKLGEMFELTTFPADHGKIVAVARPVQRFLGLSQLLQLHGQLSLADFVVGEHLKVS